GPTTNLPPKQTVRDPSSRRAPEVFLGTKWLPTLAPIERQAVRTPSERSETKSGIRALLIRPADDQMTSLRGDVEALGSLTRLEESCQGWCDRRQPRHIRSLTGSGHLASVPTARRRGTRDYRTPIFAGYCAREEVVAYGRTCTNDRLDQCRTAATDGLGAGWHDTSAAGSPRSR